MAKLVSKTYGEALFEIAMESGEDKAQELMEEIRGIEAETGKASDAERSLSWTCQRRAGELFGNHCVQGALQGHD